MCVNTTTHVCIARLKHPLPIQINNVTKLEIKKLIFFLRVLIITVNFVRLTKVFSDSKTLLDWQNNY